MGKGVATATAAAAGAELVTVRGPGLSSPLLAEEGGAKG